MSEPGYTRCMKRMLFSNLVVAVSIASVTWLARGTYDQHAMDNGVFYLINGDAESRSIELAFPSGERRRAVLDGGASAEFVVLNTGTGSVSVKVDDSDVGPGHYVTTSNPLTVVVARSDGALFSSYWRRND